MFTNQTFCIENCPIYYRLIGTEYTCVDVK